MKNTKFQIKRKFWNFKKGCRGSQIMGYALLVAAISAAFSAMYIYGKRSLQVTVRDTVDKEIGPQVDSNPIQGLFSNQTSTSEFNTQTNDIGHSRPAGGNSSYEVNSFSASSGTSTSVGMSN